VNFSKNKEQQRLMKLRLMKKQRKMALEVIYIEMRKKWRGKNMCSCNSPGSVLAVPVPGGMPSHFHERAN
jgi:hypothetical protein